MTCLRARPIARRSAPAPTRTRACNSQVPCANVPGNCSITNAACSTPAWTPWRAPRSAGARSPTRSARGNGQCPDQPGPQCRRAAAADLPAPPASGGVSGNELGDAAADDNDAGQGLPPQQQAYTGANPTARASPTTRPASSPRRSPTAPGRTPASAPIATRRSRATTGRPRSSGATRRSRPPATSGSATATPTGGACQSFKDAYARLSALLPVRRGGGHRQREPRPHSRGSTSIADRGRAYMHTWTDDSGTRRRSPARYAEEMTNYANWFAYYRTRMQAVKTVTSLTFLGKTRRHVQPRRPVPRRLPHAVEQTAAARRASSTSPTSMPTQKAAWATQLFEPSRFRSARKRRTSNAIVAHRRVLPERQQARRLLGLDRPDRPVVPEELAHAVHRRLHQPALAADD